MTQIDGYYYLHTNGELIWKPYLDGGQVADFRESSFVQHFWTINLKDREKAWSLLIEALSIGAHKERVVELATLWKCTNQDAAIYAEHIGINLYMDGTAWCASRRDAIDLQMSPHGFGDTALEAMADLAKQLGMRAQKPWGPTFRSLVECPCDGEKTVDPHCAAQGECSR